MSSIVLEIGIILGIAAVLGLIGRLIRQPPIISYLITGIIVGPLMFNLLQSTELIESLARLGVVLLLFIVGMSLDFRVLKQVGKVSIIAGLGTMILVGSITFLITNLLGFTGISALFLGVAFMFSSTVVVVKLLSDKRELDTLHGRIALGILIVEDFIAALALMTIPVLGGGGEFTLILWQIGKALIVIAGIFLFAKLLFPGVLSIAARSQEILFLFSIAWALGIAILYESLGFSIEIGALLAGMAIASSKYSLEIKGKIKGTRDLFVVLFFVFFGSQLVGPINPGLLIKAGILSAFILIGKPIIVMSFMRLVGYKKRTNFLTGSTLAQVSEFSLIILLLGFNLGYVEQELFSLSILVALITIGISSYSIHFAHHYYKGLKKVLSIFDGKRKEPGTAKKTEEYEVVLLGYNRLGYNLLKAFNREKKKYLIIDYNPDTINKLSKKGVNCLYGDINDMEFLNSLKLNKAKIVISTVPELDVNTTALRHLKNRNVIFIATSHDIEDSLKLYKEGADYVIMPHFLGGDFMAHLLVRDNFEKRRIRKEGKKQMKELAIRLLEGHQHPRKDFHGA